MASTDIQYSKYYSELEGEAKSRYEQKVQIIGLVDPYSCLESRGQARVQVQTTLPPQWTGMNGLKLRTLIFITSLLTQQAIVRMNN